MRKWYNHDLNTGLQLPASPSPASALPAMPSQHPPLPTPLPDSLPFQVSLEGEPINSLPIPPQGASQWNEILPEVFQLPFMSLLIPFWVLQVPPGGH